MILLQDVKILVVDDQEDQLKMLQLYLESYGAKVITASNASFFGTESFNY